MKTNNMETLKQQQTESLEISLYKPYIRKDKLEIVKQTKYQERHPKIVVQTQNLEILG